MASGRESFQTMNIEGLQATFQAAESEIRHLQAELASLQARPSSPAVMQQVYVVGRSLANARRQKADAVEALNAAKQLTFD